ncbi:zinc-binding alcohol dehydrogenase family protein [Paenibacillus oenotherae]|uniref:Zinc-binding alcohol dehydrogenase family protein n=1 Tax=Paenibacillus oenotherae TaxID=1435645 RepID=A0ABS7DBJ7_9BACL|nr:zinc-binding alcohol dehydrogenase family protein [Paenibacillus oenotherae]MBW7477265.1 zinc-binding alcohol dehydrogenase family protein [Paenibacillus oenotherae]
MRTILCRQIDEFEMIETERPVPQTGEALVRIKRIGICGTDLHAFKGNQPYFTYPRVLGHELSGIVEQINGDRLGLAVGDQVAIIPYLECGICVACRRGKSNCCTDMRVLGVHTDGGMREYITVPTDHLVKVNDISLDHAAVIEPLSIGAHAVRRAGLSQGETVLVIGAGPIGLGVMALAKNSGARVIVMDVSEERLQFCREWAGIHDTVNALQSPVDRLRELTGGDLPTVVFDATGNVKSMTGAFDYVAHGGKLIYVGLVKSDITFNDPDFHKKELTLMGSRNATKEDFHAVLDVVRKKLVPLDDYITHRVSFNGMIDEFERWMNPAAGVIKAMVEV